MPLGASATTSTEHVRAGDAPGSFTGDSGRMAIAASAKRLRGLHRAYFGTYEVTGGGDTVMHHVHGALNPGWWGGCAADAVRWRAVDPLDARRERGRDGEPRAHLEETVVTRAPALAVLVVVAACSGLDVKTATYANMAEAQPAIAEGLMPPGLPRSSFEMRAAYVPGGSRRWGFSLSCGGRR